MKKLFFLIFILSIFVLNAQSNKEKLNILTFKEVEKLHLKEPKPIVVFIHTNWCKVCYAMKKTTFKNNNIITSLNKDFYFISFNAESKKEISFFKNKFIYKPTGNNIGIHEIATALGTINKRISYPTIAFLNKKLEISHQINSLISSKQLLTILKNH